MNFISLLIFISVLFNVLLYASFDDRGIKKVMETESRTALIIGNNRYSNLNELKNAVNDSHDVANTLEDLNFDVIYVENGDRKTIQTKIKDFTNKLSSKKGIGMVFYSGHGVETGGVNYLLPVDANIEDKYDIRNEGISLDELLSRMEETNNRLNIVVLDACRNDPFKNRSLARRVLGESRGLAQPPVATGTYIAYSADAGQTASDGTGRNGTFTKHLLKYLKSGLPLNDVFKKTRKDVESETSKLQSPASYDKTTGEFYFKIPSNLSNNAESSYTVEDVERTQFSLNIDLNPVDSKITIEGANTKYNNGIILNKGNYSLLIERNGYQSKRIKINLQSDLNLNVQLDKIVSQQVQNYTTSSNSSSNRFTIRENVFIDNKTGYMWQKRDSERKLNWHEAKSYCENLVLDGYSDWKLPSRDEFHTLMTAYYGEWDSGWNSWFEANKHKRNSGKTDPVFVPKEISQFFGLWYWTRDISKTNTSSSWVLYFNDGYDDYNYQYNNSFVRCVR